VSKIFVLPIFCIEFFGIDIDSKILIDFLKDSDANSVSNFNDLIIKAIAEQSNESK
jgi:hypothetical protein